MNKKTAKGFTLIELLIVIAIVGILAAAVIVAINPGQRIATSRNARVKTDIASIGKAADVFNADTGLSAACASGGSYPNAFGSSGCGVTFMAAPLDPNGVAYVYTASPAGCDPNSATPCTAFSVSAPAFNDGIVITSTNNIWCFSSGSNTITQVQGVSCDTQGAGVLPSPTPTITPTSTPTPIPDNNNPFIGDITNYSTNDCNALYTWVCDRDYPAGPLTVSIYDGPKANNILVASGQTTFTWGGTNTSACATNAIYTGYSVTTPTSIKNGLTHTLYYYIGDLNVNGQPGSRPEALGTEPFKCPR